MKITLIEPKPPGLHVFSNVKLPRLGLPLIGTILAKLGHDVKIYIQEIAPVNQERLANSDIVGISTTTSTAPAAYNLADQVHRRKPGTPVIIGGPHVTFLPDEALEHGDYCVRGEGEHTITELITSLENGTGMDNIPGLSYKKDGKIYHNPARPLNQDLDSLPFPDLSLIEGHQKMRITPIATSRGCPYACRFCSVIQMFGQKYRTRDIESVLDEISEKKPKQIFFYDDNFTMDRNRTKKLMEGIIKRGIKTIWTAQVRAEVARDPELLKLMHESGCRLVYIGFESINEDTLAAYNKKLNVQEISESIHTIHRQGIKIHGMFVIGADEDDAQTARRTVDFALKHKIDTLQLMMLTPLPGTPYFEELVRDQRIFSFNWSHYDAHHVVYQPKQMSPYRLQFETIKQMQRFYSLGRCIQQASRFDVFNLYFRVIGHKIISKWYRDPLNRNFLKKLQQDFAF